MQVNPIYVKVPDRQVKVIISFAIMIFIVYIIFAIVTKPLFGTISTIITVVSVIILVACLIVLMDVRKKEQAVKRFLAHAKENNERLILEKADGFRFPLAKDVDVKKENLFGQELLFMRRFNQDNLDHRNLAQARINRLEERAESHRSEIKILNSIILKK